MNTISDIGLIVYQLLLKHGFDEYQAKLVTAQAAHETANFSSSILESNNNLFGMKYANQRFSQGEKNGYADYKDIEQSIQDYALYYTRHNYLKAFMSPESFVMTLKAKGYFEADEVEYLKGVKHFLNLYFV